MDTNTKGQGSSVKPAEPDAASVTRAPGPFALDPSPRKRVLVLASTFPRWPNDTEPPFVYNLCRSLADSFAITVLAPHAPGALAFEQMGDVSVHRFRYMWPERLEKLAYGGILPNLKRNRWLWALVPSSSSPNSSPPAASCAARTSTSSTPTGSCRRALLARC